MKFRKKRVPYIEQLQQTECGICCLSMIMSYYKKNVPLYELREQMGNSRDGISLLSLKKIAQNSGFNCKSYRVTLGKIGKIKLPAILHWEDKHFVVLERIKNENFFIVDPGSGRKKLNKNQFAKAFSGFCLVMEPNEYFKPRKKANVWMNILPLIKKSPNLFIKVAVLTLFLQLITVGMPILIQKIIDEMIIPNKIELISTSLISIGILFLFHVIVTFLRGRVLITLNNTLDYNMQTEFFNHLLRLPYQFFMVRSFGDLLFRSSSLRIIRNQLSNQLIKGLLDFSIMLVILIYMIIQSPMLSIVVVSTAALNIAIIIFSRKHLSEANQREVGAQSKLQSIQTEILYGIFGVKTSGIEDKMYNNWEKSFKNVLQAYREREELLNYVNTSSSSLQLLAPIIVLWFGAFQIFNGNMSLGVLIAFQAISGQFFSLSESLVNLFNSFILTTSYLERVEDVMKSPPEKKGHKKITDLQGNISIRNISYGYSKFSEDIIKNVSLEIKRGQKIAIIGKSGSGKTTLANLIIGLLKPKSGEILYDNKNINELDMQELRKKIGTVPQDVTLFNKTIYENITLHNKEVSEEDVINAAKAAQVHDEIMDMPMGYHTMISEMGMNLSGGQRQRIALAKALLEKPSILVLDEATSSLDHVNEELIDNYLSSINCTRIVIAHRLTTIKNSNHIILMDNGKVIEQGNHRKLIKTKSFYSDFFKNMIS